MGAEAFSISPRWRFPLFMHNDSPFATSTIEALARLEACRVFEGPLKEFWRKFVQTGAEIAQARAARVVVQAQGEWRLVTGWPDPREFPVPMAGASFLSLAEQALSEGIAAAPALDDLRPGIVVVALAGNPEERALLVVAVHPGRREDLQRAGSLLRLAADTPLLYLRQRQLEKSKRDLAHYAQALEVLAATNAHTRFLSVAMSLVNELAARFQCSRVSLGWNDGAYVRVKAISGTDRFEPKMDAVQRLEAAMEEARDQDEEILFPAPTDTETVTRDHAAYAHAETVSGLLSVPVRIDGEPVGVLLLERLGSSFSEYDAMAVRVIADQAARRLADLRANDRWFGARWAIGARAWFARFLGPSQTWLKVGAAAGTALLLFATFVPLPYRVNANFIVRADALQYLPAPFDGYLGQVLVRPGDVVNQGDLLLQLDASDLYVEQAAALAEAKRYGAEAEKAEAERKLADFRAARALEAQALARVELIKYRLARSELRAPFAGVIVEGDLRERIGAPVRAGDVVLKVSQLAGLYVEMRVPERDIDLVGASQEAEIAFTTRPEDTFAVKLARIEPSAVADRDGNAFVVRGEMQGRADWLRPGMSGVAKIEAGDRSLLWIATHRLIDFLRLKLWW
ncbi:MAG TPA: efflux RND transporter periplasmic adaptor subunit [Opitutaceae bacterium]